jgi:hypothetical protein
MSHEMSEVKSKEFKVTILNTQTKEYPLEFVFGKDDFDACNLVKTYEDEVVYLCEKYKKY